MSKNTETNTDTKSEAPKTLARKGKQKNSLTAGQKPSWIWLAVLAGAAVVGLAWTFLVQHTFSLVGFAIITAIAYIIGMYIVTFAMENRRRAADGLWKNLVWATFIIALLPLISVIWTVVANGLPSPVSYTHL